MEYTYISNIVSKLLNMTKECKVIWVMDSKTQKNYKFSHITTDEKTRFTIEFSLNDSFELPNHDMWWMYIYNTELIDGKIAVYSKVHPVVTDLVKELFNIYIESNILIKDQSDLLNKILNSIDHQGVRDGKIESIFED